MTLNAEAAITATFAAVVAGGGGGGGGGGGAAGGGASSFTLSIGKTNPGTVTSTPSGINCGNTCAAKYGAGNTVALVATPPAGLKFVGWSGACTGADPNACTVTLNADTKVQASFSK